MNNKWLVFAGIGVELMALMLSSLFFGQYIDQKFETHGIGIVGMSLLALGSWLAHIVFLLKKMDTEPE